ncbi:MAG: class I SAM-dependent methyltransferase [Ilumatobacteraceae bacterium]
MLDLARLRRDLPAAASIALDRHVRTRVGRARRAVQRMEVPFGSPPPSLRALAAATSPRRCNICGWAGSAFEGFAHAESATCPDCGSIARDRHVFFHAMSLSRPALGARIIETSPRLDHRYREFMKRLYRYVATDFDEVSHKADRFLDIQDMDLEDSSVDVFFTSHVLEHVPDPSAAARELYRVVRPGGVAVVAVPLLNGTTVVPSEPEYHEDNTLVRWRFGWDFADLLTAPGFEVEVCVTDGYRALLAEGRWDGPPTGEFDLPSLLAGDPPVTVTMDDRLATLLGIEPAFHFVAFRCVKPGEPALARARRRARELVDRPRS